MAKQQSRGRKVKVFAFISENLLGKYTALSEECGVSRSELYRLTLERGLEETSEWCREIYGTRRRSVHPVRRGAPASAVSSAAQALPVEGAEPVEVLSAYAKALFGHDPDLSDENFRHMVTAQAVVVGVLSERVEAVVDELVGRYFAGMADGDLSSESSPEADGSPGVVPDLD